MAGGRDCYVEYRVVGIFSLNYVLYFVRISSYRNSEYLHFSGFVGISSCQNNEYLHYSGFVGITIWPQFVDCAYLLFLIIPVCSFIPPHQFINLWRIFHCFRLLGREEYSTRSSLYVAEFLLDHVQYSSVLCQKRKCGSLFCVYFCTEELS